MDVLTFFVAHGHAGDGLGLWSKDQSPGLVGHTLWPKGHDIGPMGHGPWCCAICILLISVTRGGRGVSRLLVSQLLLWHLPQGGGIWALGVIVTAASGPFRGFRTCHRRHMPWAIGHATGHSTCHGSQDIPMDHTSCASAIRHAPRVIQGPRPWALAQQPPWPGAMAQAISGPAWGHGPGGFWARGAHVWPMVHDVCPVGMTYGPWMCYDPWHVLCPMAHPSEKGHKPHGPWAMAHGPSTRKCQYGQDILHMGPMARYST